MHRARRASSRSESLECCGAPARQKDDRARAMEMPEKTMELTQTRHDHSDWQAGVLAAGVLKHC